MLDLGTVRPGTTIYIPFNTFDSNDPSASVTITGLATTDIEVYKDGSVTQRASDAGYALLDTDGIDFDGTTGIHGFSIDLADNTTANFYEAGSQYWVVVASITVDAATVNFVAATFRIGYPDAILNTTIATLASQTSFTLEEGPADDDALNGMPCLVHDLASAVQVAKGIISDYTGSTRTVTLDADPGIFTMAVGDNFSVFIGDALTATAQANFQDMYDTTGYTDGTAPASRLQVDGISTASGGSLNFANEADNVDSAIKSISFDGVETSGTNASANFEDATYHQIDDTANNIDIVYQFDIGGGRVATEVTWKGRLVGTNDEMTVQAYNGTTWDTIRTISGQSNSAPTVVGDNAVEAIPLLNTHTGTGADLGLVFIRLECASQSNPTIYTDQLLVAGVNIGQTIGYANGSVWLDTTGSNTGTESFVDGVADNPVSTIAAAVTIAGNIGVKRITVAAGSSFTLAADMSNYEIMGQNYTLGFGGQTITGAQITGATLSGTFVGTTAILEDCIINAITGSGITMRRCFFNDVAITCNGAGDWFINDCKSRVAGSGRPNFDFGAAVGNTSLNMRAYSGGIELENFGDTGTDTASIEGNGNIVVNANSAGGTLVVRGNFDLTDNGASTTITQTARPASRFDGIEGTTFSTSTDSLEAIRDRGDAAWTTGAGGSNPFVLQNTTIATLASQTSFTLTAGSADDDAYNAMLVIVTDQSTSTQKAVGVISDYTGPTRTVTLREDPGIYTMATGDTVDVVVVSPDVLDILADVTGLNGDAMRGTDGANTTTPLTAAGTRSAIGLAAANLDTQLSGIVTDTEDIQARLPAVLVGGRIDATVDGTGMETGAVDAILTRQMTESYAADGTAPTLAQALFLIQQELGDFAISGTTLTVREIDGTTTAATFTLDSATAPTSKTRAT